MNIELEQDQWATVEDILAVYGKPTDSYSGRGVYGGQCIGVTIDRYSEGGLWDIAMGLASEDRNLAEDMGEPRQDSMGRSTIYYWPNVSVITDEDEEDED